MANICTICSHEKREAIDTDLLKGRKLNKITLDYGISYSSLYRHSRGCLPGQITEGLEKLGWDASTLANAIVDISMDAASDAYSDKEFKALGSILANPTRVCEILSRTNNDDNEMSGLMEIRMKLKMEREKKTEAKVVSPVYEEVDNNDYGEGP